MFAYRTGFAIGVVIVQARARPKNNILMQRRIVRDKATSRGRRAFSKGPESRERGKWRHVTRSIFRVQVYPENFISPSTWRSPLGRHRFPSDRSPSNFPRDPSENSAVKIAREIRGEGGPRLLGATVKLAREPRPEVFRSISTRIPLLGPLLAVKRENWRWESLGKRDRCRELRINAN